MKHLTTLLLLTASLIAHSSPPHLCDSTFREASSRAMELALKQTKQFNPNNRTMKKIKSDRAKAYIRQHTFDCENCDTIERHMWSSDARQAVRYAEQDAEERAIKSLIFVIARQREALEKMQVSDVFKDVTKDILHFTEKGFSIMMGGQGDEK